MVSFPRTASVEAEKADIQSTRIILGTSDKAVGPERGLEAALWSQNTAYNPLYRLTGKRLEDEALGEVSMKRRSTTVGILTSCVYMLTSHL